MRQKPAREQGCKMYAFSTLAHARVSAFEYHPLIENLL